MCSAGQPKQLLEQFIQKHFPGAEVSDIHAGGVPMAPWITPLVKDGIMLIGDAARQVNCTTGAGIAYALYSGKTAGTVAAQAFSNGVCNYRVLKDYEKAWASHYGKQQRRSHALKDTMVTFSDAFLDDVAVSLSKTDMQNMSVLKIFVKAFSKHPLQLLKVIRLFK
jgi:digeranylgeranylglycerophospholipid reductase